MEPVGNQFKEFLQNLKKDNKGFVSFRPCNIDLSMIRGDYPVSESVLSENLFSILQIEEAESYCSDCLGLDSCRQISKGICPHISVSNGTIVETNSQCSYLKASIKQKHLESLLIQSMLPKKFFLLKKSDIIIHHGNALAFKYIQWCLNNCSASKSGLYLYGPNGVGKTLLMAFFTNRLIEKNIDVLFVPMVDFLNIVRRSFSLQESEAEQMLKNLYNVSCLILDDFGAERMTYWVASEVYALLNYRYNHMLQTMITSNLHYDDLKQITVLNDKGIIIEDNHMIYRIISRIGEMCYFAEVQGDDFRLRN